MKKCLIGLLLSTFLYTGIMPVFIVHGAAITQLPVRFTQRQAECKPGKIDLKLAPYDRATDTYRLNVDIACYQAVLRVSITLESDNDGTLVKDICPGGYDCVIDSPFPSQEINFHANNLLPGQKYTIKVEATDVTGVKIVNKDGDPLLASKQFLHPPLEAPKPLDFKIESVSPDYAKEMLQIDLSLPPNAPVQSLSWIIVDSSSNRMGAFGPADFTDSRIQVPFPPPMRCAAIRSIAEKIDYKLTVELTTAAGVPATQELDFKLDATQCASQFALYWAALQNNPAIVVSIIIVTLCIIGWIVVLNRRRDLNEADEYPDPQLRPWNQGTQRLRSAQGVRLTIVQSPGMSPSGPKTITHFPYIIGRENCDLNLPGDGQISGRHLQLSLSQGRVTFADIGSKNGTYLHDQRLEPKRATPLHTTTQVRLGRHTILELEPWP